MTTVRHSTIHIMILCITVAVIIWSVIKPKTHIEWLAESVPSIIILIIVVAIYKRYRFTTLSYIIISFLTILAFIGGHYSFTEVPLFNWLKRVLDLKRNHYDRFAHLMSGLSAIVIREILLRHTPLTRGAWLSGITLNIVLAFSAVYEILEWLSTKFPLAKNASKDFLGMQGDKWDTQWDMLLAFIGTILTLWLLSKYHDRQLQKNHNNL